MLSKLLQHRLSAAFRERYGPRPQPAELDTVDALKAMMLGADRVVPSAIGSAQDDGDAAGVIGTGPGPGPGPQPPLPPPEQWAQIEAALQHSPTLAVMTAVRHALRKQLAVRVHGGALRCPLYARDLPRGELVQTLKSQFIRPGFELYVPPDILDEQKWTIDEISVFFQSGGSVKPRHAIIAEAERLASGEAPPQPTESASTLGTPVGGAGRDKRGRHVRRKETERER